MTKVSAFTTHLSALTARLCVMLNIHLPNRKAIERRLAWGS